MSKNYSIRKYQPGDENSIVELLTKAFPQWQNQKDPMGHYLWKYLENPFGSDVIVAESGDQVVGVLNNLHLTIKIGNDLSNCVLSGDVVTHPDFRGMGIYSKLVAFDDETQQGRVFGYSETVNPFVLKHYKKTPDRTRFPHPVSYMLRINDVDLFIKTNTTRNSVINSTSFKILKVINSISNGLTSKIKPDQNILIKQVQQFDKRIDALWDKVKDDYNFIIKRDSQYLNWRYCDPRSDNYVVTQAEYNGEILGYAILRINKSIDSSDGFISDLLALPGRFDVVDLLIKNACEYLDKQKINSITYSAIDENPYLKISESYGFIHVFIMKHGINCHIYKDDVFNTISNSPNKKIFLSYDDVF